MLIGACALICMNTVLFSLKYQEIVQPVLDSIEAVSERCWGHYSLMVGSENLSAVAGEDCLKPHSCHYEQLEVKLLHLSCVTRKPTMWCSNRTDTSRAVQAQKMARGWKFWV